MSHFNELLNEKEIFFKYMGEKYKVFFNSNIFLRDIQYAVRSYFENRGINLKYPEAEKYALELTDYMEKSNELTPVSNGTWKVNFHLNQEQKVESIQ